MEFPTEGPQLRAVKLSQAEHTWTGVSLLMIPTALSELFSEKQNKTKQNYFLWRLLLGQKMQMISLKYR